MMWKTVDLKYLLLLEVDACDELSLFAVAGCLLVAKASIKNY